MELIDYYSKYIEVQLVSSLQGTDVIPLVKSIFARHGIPKQIISDGGPPFKSCEFLKFSKQWKFEHKIASAKYPKSNGQIERAIQTTKQIFRKSLADSKDPYLALLLYRTTPVQGSDYSPAELLMNRKLSTTLPSIGTETVVNFKNYFKRLREGKDNMKRLTNHRKTLPEIIPGTRVLVQNGTRCWEPAVVVKLEENKPRSYVLKTTNGSLITRNRVHLRINHNTQNIVSADDCFPDIPILPNTVPAPTVSSPAPTVYKTRYGRTVRKPDSYKPY